jgi:CheY-like chemotaxis protein
VVEDNADTRQLVTALLENQGAEVTATVSAPEAFQAFRLNRPDVLLSDIGMPGEDGYALLRRIRAWEAQDAAKGNVPAVAFSAYARPEDRQQALAAGFLTHLPKPISQLHLTRAIQNAVRSGS